MMNNVSIVGRLTRDPEIRVTPAGVHVAKFTVAVDRPFSKGEEKQTDFPRIVCFGKTAENVGQYLSKGRQAAITGRIQTGSYEDKDGKKIFTTDVVADRVEFVGGRNENSDYGKSNQNEGFSEVEDEDLANIPF